MKEAVKFDRVTQAYRLREAGHPELIKLLDEKEAVWLLLLTS